MKFEFDFPLNENITEKEETRAEKLKRKFCIYAGLDPKIVVIQEDIDKNWNTAFQRVMLEEGATEEELYKVLLKI